MVSILELGIRDRFEFVRTTWPHSWATQTVALAPDFAAATPVARIPTLVADDVTLTESHAICDYLNGELGGYRLLAREGAARWKALATISIANGIIEAQVARRAELLRTDKDRSDDFIAKMRDRQMRCYAALEQHHLPTFGSTFDLAQITAAIACGYDDWRYGPSWRDAAPKLAAWYDSVAERPSLKATRPAETPQQ
jgi:glutathione S-transferase